MSLELILAIISTIAGVVSASIAWQNYKIKHQTSRNQPLSRQLPQINNQSISPIHSGSLRQPISTNSGVNNKGELNSLEITKSEIVILTGIDLYQTFKDFYRNKNKYNYHSSVWGSETLISCFTLVGGLFGLYCVYLYVITIYKMHFSHINLKEDFLYPILLYIYCSLISGGGISQIWAWKEFNQFIQRQLSEKESIILGIIAEILCIVIFIIYFVNLNLSTIDAIKLITFYNPFVIFMIGFIPCLPAIFIVNILDYISVLKSFKKSHKINKKIKFIVQEIEQYNKLIEDIKVIDKLRAVGNEVNLHNREQLIEALHITRSDLIRALKTERILREHPNFRPEKFQVNLTALNALKVSQEATEYANILNETLQIAVSVQQEMNKLQY